MAIQVTVRNEIYIVPDSMIKPQALTTVKHAEHAYINDYVKMMRRNCEMQTHEDAQTQRVPRLEVLVVQVVLLRHLVLLRLS